MGINLFDTAPIYGLGSSEKRLGKALDGNDRSKLVINTKFGRDHQGKTDFSPESIRESIDGSLTRLRVDYIDSVILHNPPFQLLNGNECPHYEILERLVEEGKILAYGASLDTHEEFDLLMETTGSMVAEVFFNILHQDVAQSFAKAREKQIAIIVKIPLDSGWLTGKYNAESTFDDVRGRWTKSDIETRAMLVDKIKAIIGVDTDLIHAAITFCLSYPAVSTVIPGNTSITQLRQNLMSLQNRVPPKLVNELENFYLDKVKHLNLPW